MRLGLMLAVTHVCVAKSETRAAVNPVRTGPIRARRVSALMAIAAIVFGILAMHFLAGLSPSGQQAHVVAGSTATVSTTHTMSDTATKPAENQCGVQCSPPHQMAEMACVLLVLFASIMLIVGSRESRSWLWPRYPLPRIGLASSALAPPRPPSLILLSISRT